MRLVYAILLLCFTISITAQSTSMEKRYTDKLTIQIEVDLPYLLHIPESTTNAIDGKWPLIVFLHGAGERGEDFELLKKNGPPQIIASGKEFPFITLSPQCPLNQYWDVQAVNALLDHIIENYPVDRSRIYLTGLSMGGFGTWDLAIAYPDKFAAIAPICGGSFKNSREAPSAIPDLPIWAFHGAMDNVVPLDNTLNIIKALKQNGCEPKLTIYPLAGHDSWTETYNNPKLYEWLLEQRKK